MNASEMLSETNNLSARKTVLNGAECIDIAERYHRLTMFCPLTAKASHNWMKSPLASVLFIYSLWNVELTYPILLSSPSSSSSYVSTLRPLHADGVPDISICVVAVVVVDGCESADIVAFSLPSWWKFRSHSESNTLISSGNGFGRNLLRPKPIPS